ncbi:hypothetical protein AC249_AIPGENE21908 [Exaiptasia diaphana]|nr:hypothetical protein AC249_AIPGENE21908 [Exaiptasia diaphana]
MDLNQGRIIPEDASYSPSGSEDQNGREVSESANELARCLSEEADGNSLLPFLRDFRHLFSRFRRLAFCALISDEYQGVLGRSVIIRFLDGSWISRIEDKSDSYWFIKDSRSFEVECKSEELQMSSKNFSLTIALRLRLLETIFGKGGLFIRRSPETAQ